MRWNGRIGNSLPQWGQRRDPRLVTGIDPGGSVMNPCLGTVTEAAGGVAQLEEQATDNRQVEGSNPSPTTMVPWRNGSARP